jgi:hypothetical protein
MAKKKTILRLLVLLPFFLQLSLSSLGAYLHLADHDHAFGPSPLCLQDIKADASPESGEIPQAGEQSPSLDHSAIVLGLALANLLTVPRPREHAAAAKWSHEQDPETAPLALPVNPAQLPLLAVAPSMSPPLAA